MADRIAFDVAWGTRVSLRGAVYIGQRGGAKRLPHAYGDVILVDAEDAEALEVLRRYARQGFVAELPDLVGAEGEEVNRPRAPHKKRKAPANKSRT